MSVLVRKRKLSELKFYDNAIRLRRSMIYLLMRDLGAKRGVRDIQWMAKDLPPQDAELLLAVAERNGLKRFETDWPSRRRLASRLAAAMALLAALVHRVRVASAASAHASQTRQAGYMPSRYSTGNEGISFHHGKY